MKSTVQANVKYCTFTIYFSIFTIDHNYNLQ